MYILGCLLLGRLDFNLLGSYVLCKMRAESLTFLMGPDDRKVYIYVNT